MLYDLPKTVDLDGIEYRIRYDFRVILDIISMLNDLDLETADKAEAAIRMFYVDADGALATPKAALEKLFWFIDEGDEVQNKQKKPRLIDWEKDFKLIIAPVNRVLGYESREIEYDVEKSTGGLHWWTFLSAYMEIGGDCMFSQVVSIRDKQSRGKRLEKWEREWASRNADLVQLKSRYSKAEDDLIKQYISGGVEHG